MSNFRVGQRVVCIDAAGLVINRSGLTEGSIYTIRHVGPSVFHAHGRLCVWLAEIIRTQMPGDPCEVGYLARRFRPAVQTDISVFKAMLAPTRFHSRKPEGASA